MNDGQNQSVPIPLSRLKTSRALGFPVFDKSGVLLLRQGIVLTPREITRIRARGIETVLVQKGEPAASLIFEPSGKSEEVPPPQVATTVDYQSPASRRLDALIPEKTMPRLTPSSSPFAAEVLTHNDEPYDGGLCWDLVQSHERQVNVLQESLTALVGGSKEAVGQVGETVSEYLALVKQDMDLFACVAAAPDRGQYPYRHAVHVAMLSIAMGVRAGLGERELRTLATGALLHDLGMTQVRGMLWNKRAALTTKQLDEIHRHPILTVEAVSRVSSVSDDVLLICYQVHERMGGQGYPRRTTGEFIHPLARIVGVADAFVAMVSERPHRPAVLPYQALESILRFVKSGWLEAQSARWLLEAITLYPVGSYVTLNSGELARVVRAHGSDYTHPTVRVWPKGTAPSDETGALVDLSKHTALRVVQAVPSPVAG